MSFPIAAFVTGLGLAGAKAFTDWRQQRKEQSAYAAQVDSANRQQQQQAAQFAAVTNDLAARQAATQAAFNKIGSDQAMAVSSAMGQMQKNILQLQTQNNANLQKQALDIETARQTALAQMAPEIQNPGAIRGIGTTFTSPLGDESEPNLGRRKLLGN